MFAEAMFFFCSCLSGDSIGGGDVMSLQASGAVPMTVPVAKRREDEASVGSTPLVKQPSNQASDYASSPVKTKTVTGGSHRSHPFSISLTRPFFLSHRGGLLPPHKNDSSVLCFSPIPLKNNCYEILLLIIIHILCVKGPREISGSFEVCITVHDCPCLLPRWWFGCGQYVPVSVRAVGIGFTLDGGDGTPGIGVSPASPPSSCQLVLFNKKSQSVKSA